MGVAAFALLVSIVSAAGTAGALWYFRGQRNEAARAARAAEAAVAEARRSADAAEASATDAKRSADAAEESVGYQREEVERNRAVFELELSNGPWYNLRNKGTGTAYGVRIDAGDLAFECSEDLEEFPAGREARVSIKGVQTSETTHLVVSWHLIADRSDEARSAHLVVRLR